MKLGDLIFQRTGLMRGPQVALPLLQWIEAAAVHGEGYIGAERVAKITGKTDRQVWRWKKTIRRYFTEEELQEIVAQAAPQLDRLPRTSDALKEIDVAL